MAAISQGFANGSCGNKGNMAFSADAAAQYNDLHSDPSPVELLSIEYHDLHPGTRKNL
jgi:hypothetical protein